MDESFMLNNNIIYYILIIYNDIHIINNNLI